jgi:hypothetical protein
MTGHTVVVLALAALSACTPGRERERVATLGREASPGPGDDTGTASDAAIRWAGCMRDHGVAVRDPEDAGDALFFLSKENVEDPDLSRAEEECRFLLPDDVWGPELAPAEEARQLDLAVRYAQCMREQGIPVPDPQAGGPLIGLGPGVDPDDPDFVEAERRCARFLRPLSQG